jgi:hypothetical protein
MSIRHNPRLALLGLALSSVGLAACGTTTSAAFKGEAHEVAQAVSNFQADARNGNETKLCTDDLSSALVTRLNSATGGCKEAIKTQLTDVDNFEVTVQSVQVNTAGVRRTGSARVTSTSSGKTRPSTLLLVKEDGEWKISGVQ